MKNIDKNECVNCNERKCFVPYGVFEYHYRNAEDSAAAHPQSRENNHGADMFIAEEGGSQWAPWLVGEYDGNSLELRDVDEYLIRMRLIYDLSLKSWEEICREAGVSRRVAESPLADELKCQLAYIIFLSRINTAKISASECEEDLLG